MADMTGRAEISQHIGWLKMYAAEMSPDNWRDMKDRIERQVYELSDAIAAELRATQAVIDGVARPARGLAHQAIGCECKMHSGKHDEICDRVMAALAAVLTDLALATRLLRRAVTELRVWCAYEDPETMEFLNPKKEG